ncbi:xylulokinase [Raineyella sp. LH-20]|uniref:xylulokinase n=1 Tax=Raineyella sp. LH-20 TaxID=3081204 RepID=UPI0029549782|nr:xylulokinase [Raineyella sp. LH-20]WOP19569.1 xylulokinase [Raineyella sp. LH-20]
MSTLVAGVDSSTQSCKVLVVDVETGRIVRSGRASHPDGTEVDPEAWWDALGAAIADAGGLDDVAAVSIGGQQHGMVVLDASGRVIRPALLWNDTRSGAAAACLVRELGADEWVRRTGLVPVASFTGTKLRWLREAEPENAAAVAAVALPHDWLSWRLRGYGPAGQAPLGPVLEELATDGSDASGTAYWDPARREYDGDLFERALGRPLREAGGPARTAAVVVPRVVAPDEAMGTLGTHVQLPHGAAAHAGLVVGPGAGDNAAAALGLGLGVGEIAISLGTSGTVFGPSSVPTADPTGTVAGFADATGGRLPIVTTLNAARVLDVMAGLLDISHEELGTLALTAPAGSGDLVLIPYFVGERTPNRPDATATLLGLTPTTTSRSYLARAAIEGMLCALADGLATVEATGVEVSRLVLIGGAARNEAVRTIAAQVFGRDIEIPAPGEYVAMGAARQAAWVAAGTLPSWPAAVTRIAADPRPKVLTRYRTLASCQGEGRPE